jgi:hypothetical protein
MGLCFDRHRPNPDGIDGDRDGFDRDQGRLRPSGHRS